MARITAHDDVKAIRKQREVKGGYAFRTEFMPPIKGDKSEPQAFLAERQFNAGIKPHFHDVDQFQVAVTGGGMLGRHRMPMYGVHFARAHTPYGPIVPDEQGLGFLTLRANRAAGQYIIPDKTDMLKAVPNRDPWQVTEPCSFEPGVHAFSRIKDERGLAAFSIRLERGNRVHAADPAMTGGQYIIVTRGSLLHHAKDHKAITIVFVEPNEKPFEVVAGSDGLDALVLNFPRQTTHQTTAPGSAPGTRVWQCILCAFAYDEAKGMPEEGIPPGTRWEDVPETWTCPDCSATKADFEMVVVS